MKTIMARIKFLFLIVFSTFLPFVVGAQQPLGGGGVKLKNPFAGEIETLPKFVEVLATNVVLPIGSVVVVLFIIYSGYLFVTAQGNPAKLETAKSAFLYACIGALVLLGAFTIAQVINNTILQITS